MGNWINSWKPSNKQNDKVHVGLRLGKLTVLELGIDFSDKYFKLMILNFGYETTN